LITERLSSGLPTSGRSDLLGVDKKTSGKSEQKGPDGFADLMQSAQRPQKDKPEGGKIEESPRTNKNLAVKDRKDKGEEIPAEKKVKEDEPQQPKTAKKSQNQRQQAMQEFMDSMESEFSIPPEKIAGAMVSLKEEDLGKTPEETASQVIQKLELDPEQESKAEALYVSMLTKLSKLEDQAEPLKPEHMLVPTHEQMAAIQLQSQAGIPQKGLQLQTQSNVVMSEKQRRIQLNDSLDRMSQKFFLSGPDGARTAEQALDPQLAGQGKLNPMLAEKTQPITAYLDQKSALDLQGLNAVKGEQIPEETYKELANKMAALGQSSQELGTAVKTNSTNLKALQMEQALKNQIGQGGLTNSQVMMMNGAAQADVNSGSEFDMQNSGSDQGQELTTTSASTADVKPGEFFVQPQMMERSNHMGATAAATATGTIRPQQAEANIQQIMNQAQYMMKKGGGESIVRLSPEGLGDLHLKVTVTDGKVNLAMAAETKEAKSLIESSLSELKSNLSSHNLKVESVKVDVGNQLASDNNNSSQQSGFKFDQGREQARQFLNNFHEENSSGRGQFFDSPSIRAYGAPKGPEPLKPSDEAQSRARRYSGEGRGNGLNLVA
jgi:flagellar hook-length control protein FliK